MAVAYEILISQSLVLEVQFLGILVNLIVRQIVFSNSLWWRRCLGRSWELQGVPVGTCTTVHVTFAFGVLRKSSILELLLKGCRDGKRFVKGVLNQP